VFGEPYDSRLTTVDEHLQSGDLGAAQEVCEQLLAMAEEPFLRAYLTANLGMVQLARMDLAASLTTHEQAFTLLREIGPIGQPWLDTMLKTLLGLADLYRNMGELDRAQLCLDDVAAWLPSFEGDGTRAAELGHQRSAVLMYRGDWAEAEEIALLTLAATPESLPIVPRLLISLGLICASTGRFDLAEDYFARAGDILGDTAELLSNRGYVAMRRGDLDTADELYTEAAVRFEELRLTADLAVCEQARGFIASARGNPAAADELLSTSLARFERHGLAIAAADTMLLASEQAYDRDDIAEMIRLAQQAREVYEAQGIHERCAEVDYMIAASIEEGLARSGYGEHEAEAVSSALSLALPAALALEAVRYDFATSHARSQWMALSESAMELVFRLATRRQDQGLLFELIEFRCAGVPLDRAQPVVAEGSPDVARKVHDWADGTTTLGGVAADAAASVGLRISLPPKILMSEGFDRYALQEYIAVAEERYHRKITSGETVESW
jgi:tetratricopeptide (TPR) repeat protein